MDATRSWVVLTVDRAVAAWAKRPIRINATTSLQAIVIGPDEVPWITEEEKARAQPELAMLSALTHGDDPDAARAASVALAAIRAVLDRPDGTAYYDLILAHLNHTAREALAMLTRNYQLQDEGLRKAWAGGEAKGKAEGEARGKAEGLLAVLEARGLALTGAQRDIVLGCTDPSQLARWLRAAVTASSADDVLRRS